MHVPSTAELLDIWDAGSDRDHTGRALLLVGCAWDEAHAGDPADLSIGARDRLLLDLRERLFGSRIDALDRCPECGAHLEVSFDSADIRLDPAAGSNSHLAFEAAGYEIAARLPTSRDLLAIRGCRDVDQARALLLSRCLVEVREAGRLVEADDLPDAVQGEVAGALGKADPQAEVELALQCAACGHGWRTHFDIVGYLWSEIEQFGRRALRDVHLLARSYGWPESAVLALSSRRRGAYLEMIVNG